MDDYAHHPTEIEAFLKSMKSLYPGRKLTVIFQPHLFTRTRDFADGFSKSLSLADELFLMDIYPARELPIPGVDSDMLFKDITSPVKVRCGKTDLMEKLNSGRRCDCNGRGRRYRHFCGPNKKDVNNEI